MSGYIHTYIHVYEYTTDRGAMLHCALRLCVCCCARMYACVCVANIVITKQY